MIERRDKMRFGLLEILLIVAVIFLFVGANQLPKIAVAIKESKLFFFLQIVQLVRYTVIRKGGTSH